MSDEIRASHILIMHEDSLESTSTRTREEALAEIGDAVAQLEDGVNFAELAKELSDCPSGAQGGDIGFFPRGATVPEFEKAAFSLQVGERSGVVETDFGYHVILRTG